MMIVGCRTVKDGAFKTNIVFTYADGSEVVKVATDDTHVLNFSNVEHKSYYSYVGYHSELPTRFRLITGFTGGLQFPIRERTYVFEDNQPSDILKSAYIKVDYDLTGKDVRTEHDTDTLPEMLSEFSGQTKVRRILGQYGKYIYVINNASDSVLINKFITRFNVLTFEEDPSYRISVEKYTLLPHFNIVMRYGHIELYYYAEVSAPRPDGRLYLSQSLINVMLDSSYNYGIMEIETEAVSKGDVGLYRYPIINGPHAVRTNLSTERNSDGDTIFNASFDVNNGIDMSQTDFWDKTMSSTFTTGSDISLGSFHIIDGPELRLPVFGVTEYVELKYQSRDLLQHTQAYDDCNLVTLLDGDPITSEYSRHELLSKYVAPLIGSTGVLPHPPYPDREGNVYYFLRVGGKYETIHINFNDLQSSRPKCLLWDVEQPTDYYDDLFDDNSDGNEPNTLTIGTTSYSVVGNDTFPVVMEFHGTLERPKANNVPVTYVGGKYLVYSNTSNSITISYPDTPSIVLQVNRLPIPVNTNQTDYYELAANSEGEFSPNPIVLNVPELSSVSSEYSCEVRLVNNLDNTTRYVGNFTLGSTVTFSQFASNYTRYIEYNNINIFTIQLKVRNINYYSIYYHELFTKTIQVIVNKEAGSDPVYRVVMPSLTKDVDYTSKLLSDNTDVDVENVGSSESFYVNATSYHNTPASSMQVYADDVLIADSVVPLSFKSNINTYFVSGTQPISLFKSPNGNIYHTLELNADGLTYSFTVKTFTVAMFNTVIGTNEFNVTDGSNGSTITIPSEYTTITDDTYVVTDLPHQWVIDNLESGSYYALTFYKTTVADGHYNEFGAEYTLKIYA